MNERLFRGDGSEHERARRKDFDPIVEGQRYGLASDVSAAIWDHVRGGATNREGLCDEEMARERFAEVAKRVAERGGRLGKAPFKWTQVDGASIVASVGNVLAALPRHKTTLVLAREGHARTWLNRDPGRTTLAACQADSEGCTPEESLGFLRVAIRAGLLQLASLAQAIAVIDHGAALVAGGMLRQELRSARWHFSNGLAHDEGLQRELAALERKAEELLVKAPILSEAALYATRTSNRSSELWDREAAEWRAAMGRGKATTLLTGHGRTESVGSGALEPHQGEDRERPPVPLAVGALLAPKVHPGYVETDVGPTPSHPSGAAVVARQEPATSSGPNRLKESVLETDDDENQRTPRVGKHPGMWPWEHPETWPWLDHRASEISDRSQGDSVDAWAQASAGQDGREERVHSAGGVPIMPFRPRNTPGRGIRGAQIGHLAQSTALSSVVMRSAEHAELDPAAAELVTRARRGGAPLDAALKSRLEAALGTQLDGVRVHTDAEADTAARALGAQAFAISDDVFFSAGAYAPQRRDGQQLIAHEIAHTVQARGASTPADAMTVSQPDDAPELEAEAFADAFVHEVGASGEVPAVSSRDDVNTPDSLASAPLNRDGGGPTLREHAASSVHLHPIEKVLKFTVKWLAKHETSTLTKHIAKHARRIAGKALHSVFKHPKKIKSLVEGAVKEASELATRHATKPISEVIEEGGIRMVRQATRTPGKVRWVVQKTFKDAIGTQGERILRIVIDQSGRVVSAFPSDRLIAIGLGLGAAEILGERSADAAERAHEHAKHDAEKEDSWSLWDFVPIIGDLWGGELNSGENAELQERAELEKDINDAITAVECEEKRTLSPDERKVVEETFRAAVAASLVDDEDGE